MKRKIVGIFVCTLMIAAAVLPVAGTMKEIINEESKATTCGAFEVQTVTDFVKPSGKEKIPVDINFDKANLISAKDTQTNPNNDNNFAIIWGVNASVDFRKRFSADITVNCAPDGAKNITIPGPDLYLIFISRVSSSLQYIPIFPFPKTVHLNLVANIDGKVRGDEAIITLEEPDTKTNVVAVGFLLENVLHNKTVKITLTATIYAYTIFPFLVAEECERNVILNIIVSPPDPPSGASAEDTEGLVDPEATFEVSMSGNKPYINTPFFRFLESHPPLLDQLIQRFLRL